MKIQALMEQRDYTYFAYGKHYGRGGDDAIKVKFPASAVLNYIKLVKAGKDEKADDGLDSLNTNVTWAILSMFETNSMDEVENFIKSGKPFNGEREEFTFGYGINPPAAKEQFLKIDDEDDDKWDE